MNFPSKTEVHLLTTLCTLKRIWGSVSSNVMGLMYRPPTSAFTQKNHGN